MVNQQIVSMKCRVADIIQKPGMKQVCYLIQSISGKPVNVNLPPVYRAGEQIYHFICAKGTTLNFYIGQDKCYVQSDCHIMTEFQVVNGQWEAQECSKLEDESEETNKETI